MVESAAYELIKNEGIQKGVQLGIRQGLQQGIRQGLHDGMLQEAREAILDELKKNNIHINYHSESAPVNHENVGWIF